MNSNYHVKQEPKQDIVHLSFAQVKKNVFGQAKRGMVNQKESKTQCSNQKIGNKIQIHATQDFVNNYGKFSHTKPPKRLDQHPL
jgi:hypothetical protein